MNAHKPIDLLLVEDDPADVDLTREAMEDSSIKANLHVVNNGLKALAFLRKEGEYTQAPTPDLIFLDLNMPEKDGREVLAEVKQNLDLRFIPVIVLTTSNTQGDITNCYRLGANCYITKPTGLERFKEIVEAIENFWFKIARLPARKSGE